MSNKNIRQRKEMENLFADPKYYRQAWKAIGMAIAMQPAIRPIATYDRDGNETFESLVETYSYDKLSRDIRELGKENREPTELEMILHCQMIRARSDTSAAIFVRDTLGAKPVDESKADVQLSNPYEQLTDEELELLQQLREKKALEASEVAAIEPLVTPDAVQVPAAPCNTEQDDTLTDEATL